MKLLDTIFLVDHQRGKEEGADFLKEQKAEGEGLVTSNLTSSPA
jgi:hypothetical protein